MEADDDKDRSGLTTPTTAPSRPGDARRRDPGGEEGHDDEDRGGFDDTTITEKLRK